jgi:hypothetical protein
MMRRKGRVLADHFFSRLLKTPTEVVNAIRYVLGNHSHHFGTSGVDPFSSAALSAVDRDTVLTRPVGWLLRVGWRRARTACRLEAGTAGTLDPRGQSPFASKEGRAG